MAIVKMHKVSVIGMIDERQSILDDLMDLGVVEISNGTLKLQNKEWSRLVTQDGDEGVSRELERRQSDADFAIEILQKHAKLKAPLFSVREKISTKVEKDKYAFEQEYQEEVEKILGLDLKLQEAHAEVNEANAKIMGLRPWEEYDLPLEMKETRNLSIKLGTLPPLADPSDIEGELDSQGFSAKITEIARDKQQTYVYILYFKADEDGVWDIIRKNGFSEHSFDNYQGTPAENIESLKNQIEKAREKQEEISLEIADEASRIDDIKLYRDLLQIRIDKSKVRNNLLNTERAFHFDGWVPVVAEKEVSSLLDKYTCAYEFEEPREDDNDIPVQFKNKGIFSSAEFITRLYSLPNPHEVDPTSIFTFFYILFFGMMFGDVGYGLIIMIATAILLKKGKVEGQAKKLMHILFYSGISSVFWGVMFGSYFGDAIPVVAKTFFNKTIIIKPLWLDPGKSAMLFLMVSCGLGILHLFVGMGIDAYEKIRSGKVLSAINDDFAWYLIVLGAVGTLFGKMVNPSVPKVGKAMLIAGLIMAIILPFFINKGIGKAIGLWNIYSGLTGNLSDILSYSRLLGLGLASTSIAQVFNFLASMGGKSVVGVIMFILIFTLGHTLNFAINALGAFVHSCRLQFVEFFGKFYEGGGREFTPFEKNTKYIKVVEEEK